MCYPVDKAAGWPLQFATRLGGAALQSALGSPLAAGVASQVFGQTRDARLQSPQREGAAVFSLAFLYNDPSCSALSNVQAHPSLSDSLMGINGGKE